MQPLSPKSPEDLAEALATAAGAAKTINLGGAFTKNRMGHLPAQSDITISTSAMSRVLQYEPGDLTISVEAGLPFAELTAMLAKNRQMVPLDPPFHETATVGGVVAANLSGPRRRLFGTARDLIIGMTFVTLDGKLVRSGGMVVKNAAGLDMAKLMIGSLGTLAAMAVINFKLVPMPLLTRTFVSTFSDLDDALKGRDALLAGVVQPAALDLLNQQAAARIGRKGHLLLVQVGGSQSVIERYTRELGKSEVVEGTEERRLWLGVREFTPDFLNDHAAGATVRISSTLAELRPILGELTVPAVARAGSGVTYAYFEEAGTAATWVRDAAARGRHVVLDFGPSTNSAQIERWPNPGPDFAMMEKIKQVFDPKHLLNRGRLYGRL